MSTLLLFILAFLPSSPEVVVENPDELSLRLFQVEQTAVRKVRELGTAKSHVLRLPKGLYVIVGFEDDTFVTQLPLPLPANAKTPKKLSLVVRRPPPSDDAAWRWIPAGPALIGDVLGVGQEDERPARVIDIPPFWMSRDEVTNAQYARFLNAQPRIDERWLNLDSRKIGIARKGDRFVATRPEEPIITVSWYGARDYCKWLTSSTGITHRLPTEIEWEKAARGPRSHTYAYGNVYTRSRANQESGALRAVGAYGANGFGLRDMTGNAFEWVATIYNRDDVSPFYVLRGGSFVLDGMYLRNSFRMFHRPTVMADDFGFRVVREATPTSPRPDQKPAKRKDPLE